MMFKVSKEISPQILEKCLKNKWTNYIKNELPLGLFEKWSILDPKSFYAIPSQKLLFLVSLYSEFLEKKNKEIKKVDFWSILGVFVSPSMLI